MRVAQKRDTEIAEREQRYRAERPVVGPRQRVAARRPCRARGEADRGDAQNRNRYMDQHAIRLVTRFGNS